jgi:hypothetical protein
LHIDGLINPADKPSAVLVKVLRMGIQDTAAEPSTVGRNFNFALGIHP